jgi:hypothetical protein
MVQPIKSPLPITALARSPEQLDLFFCGNDGLVYTAYWAKDSHWSSHRGRWEFPRGITLPSRARKAHQIDLFVCANDRQVYILYTTWWSGHRWEPTWKCLGGTFPPGSNITAISRQKERIDLFACGDDGCVYTCNWSHGKKWSISEGKWTSLGGRVLAGANMTAIARKPDTDPEHLDVFVCGNDGRVCTGWWSESSGWSSKWKNSGGYFPAGMNISAVARSPYIPDLFACGNDGHTYTCWWGSHKEWSGISQGWKRLDGGSPPKFLPGSDVSAVSCKKERLDIFICGVNGQVYTGWWEKGKGWNCWEDIGGEAPCGAVVACVNRKEEHLDLFTCDEESLVRTCWREKGREWSGIRGWYSVGQLSQNTAGGTFEAESPATEETSSAYREFSLDNPLILFDAASLEPDIKAYVCLSSWIRALLTLHRSSKAKGWLKEWRTIMRVFADPPKEQHKRVKVAILDTGIAKSNPDIKEKGLQIKKCCSFIDGQRGDEDVYGHGTYTANLLLSVAPDAELYIA